MKLDAKWVVGFVDGEGCFFVGLNSHPELTAGYQLLPEFTVVQHKRDVQILFALKDFFGCGVVRVNREDWMAYSVRKLKDLRQRIIPFFELHPLKTKKRLDFIKFRKIILMMEANEHLDKEGFERIRRLASRINRGRKR